MKVKVIGLSLGCLLKSFLLKVANSTSYTALRNKAKRPKIQALEKIFHEFLYLGSDLFLITLPYSSIVSKGLASDLLIIILKSFFGKPLVADTSRTLRSVS